MTVYRATTSYSFSLSNGQTISMHTGDLVDENHPAYKHAGSRSLLEVASDSAAVMSEPVTFGPPPPERTAEEVSGAVETATAAPGEHRSVSNPRRRRSE